MVRKFFRTHGRVLPALLFLGTAGACQVVAGLTSLEIDGAGEGGAGSAATTSSGTTVGGPGSSSSGGNGTSGGRTPRDRPLAVGRSQPS